MASPPNVQTAALRIPALNLAAASAYAAEPIASGRQPGEPLKILYLVHAFYPESYTGTEKFVLQLARTMQQRGHRVKVIACSESLAEPSASGDIASVEYEHEGIPVLAYRGAAEAEGELMPLFRDPGFAAFADDVLLREQPDILHVAHAMNGTGFIRSALKLGIPYVMTLTDYWLACPKSTLLRTDRQLCAGPEGGSACALHCLLPGAAERLQALAPLLQGARRIVAPSTFLASYMKGAMPSIDVDILPHGMRLEAFVPNARTYRAGDRITLVYGGSLGEHKGVHVLLAAMAMIRSRQLRLHIYGSGDPVYADALKRAAAGDSRISFRGTYAEDDLPRIYHEADVAVVPSVWYENAPLTLREALASRVPVIASGAGGMAEKIVDGLNGFTFRIGDARHLAARLKLLLRNPAILNTLKANIAGMQQPALDAEMDAYASLYASHARVSC